MNENIEKMIMIGHQNFVPIDKIIAILSRKPRPVDRLIKRVQMENKVINATKGRQAKSILMTENDFVFLSSLSTETLAKRANQLNIEMLNIGNENFITSNKIQSIIQIDSAPIKKLIDSKQTNGQVLNLTSGNKTKSAIITDNGFIFLSKFETETLKNRF